MSKDQVSELIDMIKVSPNGDLCIEAEFVRNFRFGDKAASFLRSALYRVAAS